jgi:flagellar protein FliT
MSRPIIEYYEKIEQVSQKMLRAAKNSAWDELYAHEENCKILINELRETARNTELTKMQRQKKTAIMLQILKNDAQIRILIEPWLSKVDFSSNTPHACLH